MFYNTINLPTDKFIEEEIKTAAQEKLILDIFQANPTLQLNPSRVLKVFIENFKRTPPLTSIRRGMSNLSNGKHYQKVFGTDAPLVKTGNMVPGTYHLPEHTWMLRTEENLKHQIVVEKGKNTADFANKIIELSTAKLVQKDIFKDAD